MRKDGKNYERPEIKMIRNYHSGSFKSLKAFNSDRVVLLNNDYTVSNKNTASTLKITKEGSHMKVYGLEIETVSPLKRVGETVLVNVIELAINKAGLPDDLFKVERDCTVDAECITQVFTKAWLRNNYKCFKALYECFENLKISTNSEKCGMHVNIDLANFGKNEAEQLNNVRKLGYLINKHYDFFRVAFNRLGSNEWCPKMNDTKEYWKNTDISRFPTSHSACCINMGHISQSRVEIRLVAGQRNFPCFRNTMETVFHIVDNLKGLSWDDLDNLYKVFKGCNKYVFDRLADNCVNYRVIDMATIEKIRPTVDRTADYI